MNRRTSAQNLGHLQKPASAALCLAPPAKTPTFILYVKSDADAKEEAEPTPGWTIRPLCDNTKRLTPASPVRENVTSLAVVESRQRHRPGGAFLTDVEVGDLEALLLGQVQQHLDVIGVGDAQRASPQRAHLLQRGVSQAVKLDAPLRALKYLGVYGARETFHAQRAERAGRATTALRGVTSEGRGTLAYPRDLRGARQTVELGHHLLRRHLLRRLFRASRGWRDVTRSALALAHKLSGFGSTPSPNPPRYLSQSGPPGDT